MKTHRIILILWLIFLLAGCKTTNPKPTMTSSAQATEADTTVPSDILEPKPITITATSISSSTATLVPSATASVTETPRSTVMKTLQPTVLQPTFSSEPGLTGNERDAYFLELITNNGDCDPPCYWGIIPGHSSVSEYYDLFTPVGDLRSLPLEFPYSFRFSVMYEKSNVSVNASVENNIVRNIRSRIGSMDKVPELYLATARYSLDHIFSLHGKPSRIVLGVTPRQIEAGPTTFFYDLWIFYDADGFVILNRGPLSDPTKSDTIRICPKHDELYTIELYLQAPDDTYSLNELVDQLSGESNGFFDGLLKKRFYQPLEDVTNLSLDQFYETILASPQATCFETTVDLWP